MTRAWTGCAVKSESSDQTAASGDDVAQTETNSESLGSAFVSTGSGGSLAPATDTLAAQLQEVVTPAMGAVTPLSHSRSRIFIEGDAASEVLAKGIPLDFHASVFTVGQRVWHVYRQLSD